MRKRLQKKLFKGPFERFGFDVTGKFAPKADKEIIMWALFEFLEERKMTGAIGYLTEKEDFDWYIDVGTRSLNQIRNKEIVIDWLKNRDDLLSFEANELHDFDDNPFYD